MMLYFPPYPAGENGAILNVINGNRDQFYTWQNEDDCFDYSFRLTYPNRAEVQRDPRRRANSDHPFDKEALVQIFTLMMGRKLWQRRDPVTGQDVYWQSKYQHLTWSDVNRMLNTPYNFWGDSGYDYRPENIPIPPRAWRELFESEQARLQWSGASGVTNAFGSYTNPGVMINLDAGINQMKGAIMTAGRDVFGDIEGRFDRLQRGMYLYSGAN